MSKRAAIFESSVERLARLLSQRWGIRVVFKHDTCFTEGKTIYLPAIPANADEKFQNAILGHMDHEVAHIIFSDFAALSRTENYGKLHAMVNALEDPRVEQKYVALWRGARSFLKNSFEWALSNIVTVRDNELSPGQHVSAAPWDLLSPFHQCAYLICLLPQVGYDYDHWFFRDVASAEDVERVRLVEDLIRKAVSAANTSEVIDIAQEVLRRLEDPANAPPPQPSPGDSGESAEDDDQQGVAVPQPQKRRSDNKEQQQDASDDEEQEANGQPTDSGGAADRPAEDAGDSDDQSQSQQQQDNADESPSDDAQRAPSEASDDARKGNSKEGQDSDGDASEDSEVSTVTKGARGDGQDQSESTSSQSDGGSDLGDGSGDSAPMSAADPTDATAPEPTEEKRRKLPAPLPNPTPEQLEQAKQLMELAEQIRQHALQGYESSSDTYAVYSTDGDVVQRVASADLAAYKTFTAQISQTVAVMKRRLSRSLLATSTSRWQGNQLRGRINPRAVFRVPLGTSKRVFRKRVEHEGFDTVVEIMIDHSGSMNGEKLVLAAQTAIVIAEVCDKLRLPVAIYGFSTGMPSAARRRYYSASPSERTLFTRWGEHWVGVYKDFDESWHNAAPRCITMIQNAQVNTYDGESLRWGAQQLLNRKEKRKVLFWLNDGEPWPNTPTDDMEAHVRYAKECAVEVEKHVELLAIGVMTDKVRDIYSNCVVVNDIKELPGVCLHHFDELLRKGKQLRRRGR